MSSGERDGYLRLTTGRLDGDVLQARNTLTQRTFGPVSSATTRIEIGNMKDGDCAGLIALQKKYGFVGVKIEGDSHSIVMVSGQSDKPETIESIPLAQQTVYLRIDCDFRDRADKAYFYYSLDGKTWTKIGSVLQMAYTLPHFMGYRYGLFNYATKTAGGFVDFDYYHTDGEIANINMYQDRQSPPGQDSDSPNAGRGPGRGRFGGPIELGLDDKPMFDDPPADFTKVRESIAHGKEEMIEYDSRTVGTEGVFERLPSSAPRLPIDYHIICDDTDAYLFFTGDNGCFYRSRTRIEDFSNGFGDIEIAIQDNRNNLFEGSMTCKVKGTDTYLTIIEALSPARYYRAWVSSDLNGAWSFVAGVDSWETPFAGINNVAIEEGVSAWTRDISHGEALRDNYDQRPTVDLSELRFLFQRRDPESGGDYSLLPYQLG